LVRSVVGYCIAALLILVLIQQVLTTTYLGKIDAGLRSSLSSTKQLSAIQSSVIEKNGALTGIAKTTDNMDTALGTTLQLTQTIDRNIHQIDDLNVATLSANRQLAALGKDGQTNLTGIAQNLQTFAQVLSQLQAQVAQLDGVVRVDQPTLHDMKLQTDTMNRKVPGVLR
jgi:hypothetical protein